MQEGFVNHVKRRLQVKVKHILASEDEDKVVKSCTGVGNPTNLCVNVVGDWVN